MFMDLYIFYYIIYISYIIYIKITLCKVFYILCNITILYLAKKFNLNFFNNWLIQVFYPIKYNIKKDYKKYDIKLRYKIWYKIYYKMYVIIYF